MKKIISLLTGLVVAASCSLSAMAKDGLIAPQRSELLGVASSFSIFIENDFGAHGSDCEGRIACGGGANLGKMEWYSTNTSQYASVIVGRGPLQQFDGGNRIFVASTQVKDSDIKVNGTIYKEDLIDFSKEFAYLRQVSKDLSKNQSGTVTIENSWCKYITFTGDKEYNYFTVDSSLLNTDKTFVDFQVPADSYCVVNVIGKSVDLNTQLYGMSYGGKRVSGNNDEINNHILYNLVDATEFTFGGTGTFYGSVLAPNADGTDSMTSGAHVAGELIAKSYFGGIEYGGIGFTGDKDKNGRTTTSTETTTTTITTEATTTTSLTSTSLITTSTEKSTTTFTIPTTVTTTIPTTTSTTSTTISTLTPSATLTTETTTATATTTATTTTTLTTPLVTTTTTKVTPSTTMSTTELTSTTTFTTEPISTTYDNSTHTFTSTTTLESITTTTQTITSTTQPTTSKTTITTLSSTIATTTQQSKAIESSPKTSDKNLIPISIVAIVAAASCSLMKKKK